MFRATRLRMVILAVVLGIAVASVAGITFSSTESKGVVTAVRYSDVVRFTVQNEKVEILRAEVFDLGGKRLFDSGPTMGNALDWAMTTEAGERVAHGVYLYVITAWDSGGELLKSQVGKLALVPGAVGLGRAPSVVPTQEQQTAQAEDEGSQVRALWNETGDFTVQGKIGVGTETPGWATDIQKPSGEANIGNTQTTNCTGGTDCRSAFSLRNPDVGKAGFYWYSSAYGYSPDLQGKLRIYTQNYGDVIFEHIGNVGIGTRTPSAALEIHGSTTNLFALYDPVNGRVFRVEKDGDVRADGAYYSGTGGYYTGSADVAERINSSEWVEQGNVVEIDPEHPGFFRKTRNTHSTNVAGVISTSPGVILGNDFEPQADRWEDNRPMLALAGRVPVKVTAENGPIQVGDSLVSSSKPGYAMRCGDEAACVGATIGKALESQEEGTGEIMVQVALR